MGPLKSFKFWHAMEQKLHDKHTSPEDKVQFSALFGVGRQKKRARNALEKKADEAITTKALEMGVTQEELDMAEGAKVGSILPAGWFQALLAALPGILAFIAQILAMFGLNKPVPHPVTSVAEGTDSTFVAQDKFHVDHAKHGA